MAAIECHFVSCEGVITAAFTFSVKCRLNVPLCLYFIYLFFAMCLKTVLNCCCIFTYACNPCNLLFFFFNFECVLLCAGTQLDRRGSRPLQQPTTEGPWWAQDACRTSRLDNQADITGPLCWLCTFDWLSSVLSPSVVSVCQGIILVYDITDDKSFENIQNWMKSIKEVRLFPLIHDKDKQETLKRNSAQSVGTTWVMSVSVYSLQQLSKGHCTVLGLKLFLTQGLGPEKLKGLKMIFNHFGNGVFTVYLNTHGCFQLYHQSII